MRNFVVLLIVMLLLGMTGCAKQSRHMRRASSTTDTAANSGESNIVFFRSVKFGGGIQSPVIEADENGKLSYVAIVSARAKYLHRTTPGRHLFMLSGESSDMLEAHMEAGKTYYVYITPGLGIFKARFYFKLVTDTSDEVFIRNFAKCRWVQNTSSGQIWFENNLQSLQKNMLLLLNTTKKLRRKNEKSSSRNTERPCRFRHPQRGRPKVMMTEHHPAQRHKKLCRSNAA